MKRVLIHRSVKINSPAAATQISMLAWLAVHVNCHSQPDSHSHGWFCSRALWMIKTKSSLQLPWKYRFRYSPGWWSSCTSTKPNQNNLSRQAPLFQQEADEKVIPQQANQTLWLFHIRQDQTLLLFFVAVPSVIPQCIKSQCCNTEDGKWEYSLTHYSTTTTKTITLSSGSVA